MQKIVNMDWLSEKSEENFNDIQTYVKPSIIC